MYVMSSLASDRSYLHCTPPGWKSRDSVPQLVEWYLAGKVKVEEFVSHTMSLPEINNAFAVMHEGQR